MTTSNTRIQAVVFDWAGTTVDFGSRAPILAFMALFADNKVAISIEEARAPMGLEKRDHIAAVLNMPRVAEAWKAVYGTAFTTQDIDRLYQDFIPYQLKSIPLCSALIPGATETFQNIRERGAKIGSNTGYASMMIGQLVKDAAEQGYQPDCIITASDVKHGRPYPEMLWKNLIELDVSDIKGVVKVDDTVVGIEEGLNGGCWTVALAISGNEVGLSFEEWQQLPQAEQKVLKDKAYAKMNASGAHYVIDSIADLPAVLDDIEKRLQIGEKP
ncbi:phosphonoacetaldehyde hydrolase [Acinetobacter chinensis]|uniref:Phosphonoacetaldehyde hydrolase n=1 Tax=Acinetobacter chinensis TaxID=2004650 RepID=A0ABU3WDG5_9GAMM|nr:phosphonoacetaldehyde hydrolase [Acinetobacter chinensis]MDV2468445.1 phosphonoacetaldehyde hydrolase [Acinetobacter chinensis]